MVAIYLEVARGVREFWWCCGRLLSGPKGGVVQKGGSRLTYLAGTSLHSYSLLLLYLR